MSQATSAPNIAEIIAVGEEMMTVDPSQTEVRRTLLALHISEADALCTLGTDRASCTQAMAYLERATALAREGDTAERAAIHLRRARLQERLGDASATLAEMRMFLDIWWSLDLDQTDHLYQQLREQLKLGACLPLMNDVRQIHCLRAALLPMTRLGWFSDVENSRNAIRRFISEYNPGALLADTRYLEMLFHFASCCHLTGFQPEAVRFATIAIDAKEALGKDHPLHALGIRFLQTRTATVQNIGQLFPEADYFVKAAEMGWNPKYRGILLAPREKTVNEGALSYWRRHVCAVTSPRLIERLKPTAEQLEYNTFWMKLPDGSRHYFWQGYTAVERHWEERGGRPLLRVTQAHRQRGRAVLEQLGVPRDAWFVALHVRDQKQGKLGQKIECDYSSHRDADIFSYDLAIDEIIRRGGWVVRMGDVSMRPLRPRPGVVDYAHSPLRSGWMDLFSVAECRFFLGSASGPNTIPIAFGVPSLLTNLSPFNIFAVRSGDLMLPKLMRRQKTGEFVSFPEALKPAFHHLFNSFVYANLGVDVVDNTPEELREAVIEMFDRLQGCVHYTQEDEALQQRFRQLVAEVTPNGIGSRVGASFLRAHKDLLYARASLAVEVLRDQAQAGVVVVDPVAVPAPLGFPGESNLRLSERRMS